MRLHLTIQRHGLPVTRILWTTSPPSLFGHGLTSPSPIVPAASSAVTSSRAPNALYANGGYTIAQLLEDVNEVIPLETEPRLFGDESSGQWGLEDYVVEVGGSECLHFMEVEGLLREGDEVLIRALQISDLRARRLSGRHQISVDGKHLIDGVPFGKPFLKRPTSSRPAITIPPRKKRRTALALWGSGSSYEEEDTEWAPSQQISAGKELSLLHPASELEKETEAEYEDAYQDDYEDYHEPNEDGDGTVIRHNIDKSNGATESDDNASSDEDLSQELHDLKKDMEVSLLPEVEKAEKATNPRGYPLRSRPSIPQAAPRKSSLSRRSTGRPPEASRRDSKSVTFEQKKQELPVAQLNNSVARAGSTSEEPEDAICSDSESSSSASETSVSESSDGDSSSDDSVSASEASSGSNPESESSSSSESSAAESESEPEDIPEASTILKPSHNSNPPGAGSLRTKKSNRRVKLRRRLTKLKELGILGEEADFAALRQWESDNGGSFYIPDKSIDLKKRAQEEFVAKRQKLLQDLESGGVDVTPVSEKENISPSSVEQDASELLEDRDELYETANDTNEASPEVPQRRTLDVAGTRRLLFGSLGVRAPRSKEEEEATRKKLAGKAQKYVPRQTVRERTSDFHESEPEVDWREKLNLGATECVHEDIELSTPPFPFEQRWDAEAGDIMRKRNGRGQKRKRRQQLQIYDDEGDYNGDDDTQLNYDDSEQPQAEINNKDESEQTAAQSAESTGDDLPALPSDPNGLPNINGGDMKPGLVFAFKQLDVSKATNWQPAVSEYRVAVVSDVFGDNILGIRLARPYRRQPRDVNDEEGPFQYSGFEMPGMDEEEGEDDGFREVPFDDLIDPKLLRAAPPADAGDQDTASILPADEEEPVSGPSQPAVDDAAPLGEHEDDQIAEATSAQPPSSSSHGPTSNLSFPNADSPVRSPRFEGFELSHSGGSPPSSLAPSSPSDTRDEAQRSNSIPKESDNAQSAHPSTCPPNADDHDQQEMGLTEQLQTISSPGSGESYDRLMNFFLSQDLPSSIKRERESSPVDASSGPSSPVVPNPFYEIDKAHEERRQNTRIRAERDHSYDSASSREPSLKSEVPSSPKTAPKPPHSMQDPPLLSVIPDSIQPAPREPSQSPLASQAHDFIVDLTQSSPPVSPEGSDEDFAKTVRLPRGSGWVPKNVPRTRRQTMLSSQSSREVRTLEEGSISPPRRRRGPKS
ncbi:uncharacterized protein BJX67DRAFT_383330 [Aspergillus lucknowensis]|uniref:DUF7357 domain-containing protein n=1 Tax=Aspergillus lucknowensis TaxID=176173 RepID=A0ABR4LKA4_9EURO